MVFLKFKKGKFSTNKSISKSESFKKIRHQKNQSNPNLASGIREEHDYCVTVSDNLNVIKPVSNIAGGRSDEEVELIYDRTEILPDNLVPLNFCLESCSNCMKPLHLKDSLGVLPRGLGGWLYIECKQCIRVKKIPLSKRHFTTPSQRSPGVFDVNTKIATGMLHVGLGETQLRNWLASVNLHYLSVSGLKTREEEVGAALESYAEESMITYLNMESNLQENTHGCASLIGQKTGKVLNVKIKSKNCRTCDIVKRKGIVPKEHNCSKNHTGSSKGMEPALVVDMIKDVINKGVDIKKIAGDDDTTGFQRAQNVLKIKLKKRSDKKHIKKNISKQLYAIKTNYKELSQRVINYIMQNFSYMVAQNKKNTEGVTTGLKAMVGHIFGDHGFCNTKWCVFLENPLAKFSRKLANLASTQTNENLNQMLATKAPKYKHYSASNSLSYRFSATVAQKNEGHRYVHERATFMDKIRRKYSKLQKTRKYKRRRIELKSEKCNSNVIAEVLEETTYESNIDIEDDITDQLEEIPTWKQITAEENFPIIVFDLETTGLSRQSDIVQIAAVTENETFSAYVIPSKKITPQASDITKLAFFDGQMYYDEVPVESSPPF
ncbi:unnamed protein product [Mytilus coruscus]|uniref:Mutator-like transposase domain-containing protein n=1 Tax=Mytilus coruscus TaxID=42192 RepID=A0A6J8C2J3_MYTCO|nr:unnamed protein product [Mytilus coruscus]